MPIFCGNRIIDLGKPVDPLFFLAGPVKGGGDHQADTAERIIHHNPRADIIAPTYWDEDWAKRSKLGHYIDQTYEPVRPMIEFTDHFLRLAGMDFERPGCIIFWLACEDEIDPHPLGSEHYAKNTFGEIDDWSSWWALENARVIVGGDPNFPKLAEVIEQFQMSVGEAFRFYLDKDELIHDAFEVAHREPVTS